MDQYHKKAISLGTYRYHERASRQLAKFMETSHRYQSLPYSMIDPELMADFDVWLALEMKRKGRDGRGAR